MEVSEESPMQAIFGNHPQVKIIETLVLHPDFDYNLTELAENAEVSRATVFALKDKLLHYGVMKPTKKVGRIQLYRFNKDSPTGKLLNTLSFKLADIDIDLLLKEEDIEEAKKQEEVVTAY
ncbi:hypothetical protein CW713_08080 [Methanophagales archaeon]|nr:MAG: hypothetical protein CW714_09410 [Methanophagales archaeon]RJS79724.1 MAG: hypothetical protein CW713_08080 [Methanophagales archaeon]